MQATTTHSPHYPSIHTHKHRVMQARISEFLESLVQTHDHRWIFSGILNGWPAMQNLQAKQ